ncbi:MAG: extracellular solute-binding protein [Phycisphaerales bacterium]|nr:extracellular solute-binding protein [Phycisphaerales bacterium]
MSPQPASPSAPSIISAIPPGGWLIAVLAALSMAAIGFWPSPPTRDRTMWTFAQPHYVMYGPIIDRWNAANSPTIDLTMLGLVPMERRMLASFMSGTRSADLLEVERRIAARAFTGPLDAVGFVDLTDRLKAEGLLEQINAPSFSPWTSRGRIFGLPHDVHPVMLGYRSDLVEAAGIDVRQIETWDDFARVMKPLMKDADGDGQPDRYLLNMWETHDDHLEVLLLQAGGRFFDDSDRPIIDSETNARVLATIVSWCNGPDRIAADAPDFTASGNKLKSDGYVVCTFMPDWMCDVWRHELPGLAGKVKLMPLPAWEKGGRRASVWGGTMLGIPRTAARTPAELDSLFAFAKHLYCSKDLAQELFRNGRIITPVKSHWSDPVFDEPDPYLGGQKPGRMYIDLASAVPARTSSPYNTLARFRMLDALVKLSEEARRTGTFDRAALTERAMHYLKDAQHQVLLQVDNNVFLRPPQGAEAPGE